VQNEDHLKTSHFINERCDLSRNRLISILIETIMLHGHQSIVSRWNVSSSGPAVWQHVTRAPVSLRSTRDSNVFSTGGQSPPCLACLPRPHPPRQAGQDERHDDGGEEVDRVVVQDRFPTDAPRGGRLVRHHLPDARVEACRRARGQSSSRGNLTNRIYTLRIHSRFI